VITLGSKSERPAERTILFVCVENAGRSQMAEVGIDVSSQKSKIITEDMIRSSAQSVNMGCMERAECPMLFINNVIDWGIEDPKGKSVEKV
jgi:arsenate reductase (thioredoxin)